MQLLTFVGGFHPRMPLEELKALGLEVENKDGRVVIGEVKDWKKLKRLGYSHLLHRFLGEFSPDQPLPFNPEKHIQGKFAARFKKLDFAGDFDETRKDILEKVESHIEEADLRNPDTTIYFFLRDEQIYAGKLLHEFDASEFFQRKSGLRPYSQPISLPPREARCWVNFSQVEEGEKLLDPFCGTGGILIEAGLIGCDPYGSDLDPEMVSGTQMNLDYFGLEAKLRRCKAQDLSKRWDKKFDAVVTDPPYGRAAKVGGEEVKEMYRRSIPELEKVLKNDKRCVLGAPKKIELKKIINESETNFRIQTKFQEKVHGSLQREIFVLEK